ncbi:thiamine phosphate synthase [Anaerobium acetethylicum]|nr:thiamine phosphate synthase [Anaerobium acetethylicum]
MSMYNCRVFAVTNRKLCRIPFLDQVEKIAEKRPAGIILREKDLSESEYMELAGQVMGICRRYGVECILHTYMEAALHLGCPNIHLPIGLLRNSVVEMTRFKKVGVSVHSGEEALEAQGLGATCLIAGHIFETGCKKGLPPRGIPFLEELCRNVDLPVYAIGGINRENAGLAVKAGADGVCIMSGFMNMD